MNTIKIMVLNDKSLVKLGDPLTNWNTVEKLCHEFTAVFFHSGSTPPTIGPDSALPKGALDPKLLGDDALKMGGSGIVRPDTYIYFGDGIELCSPGQEIDKTNALLMMEYTKVSDLGPYLTDGKKGKMIHSFDIGHSMAKRKKGGVVSVGELIHQSSGKKTSEPNKKLGEFPLTILVATDKKFIDEDNLPDAGDLEKELKKHRSKATISSVGNGSYLIKENDDTISFIGIMNIRKWIDICSTMLVLQECEHESDLALDRIVWEITAAGLTEDAAFRMESSTEIKNPWQPSKNRAETGAEISFMSGAKLNVDAYFGIDQHTLMQYVKVPRTSADPNDLQRPLNRAHLEYMASSIDLNKQLPGVITAFSDAEFSKKDRKLNDSIDPNEKIFRPYSIEIIDGQHRVFSGYFSKKSSRCDLLIYHRKSGTEEEIQSAKAELFFDINYRAKKPSQAIALYHASQFESLESTGWITKNVSKRGKTVGKLGSYNKEIYSARVHAYSFLLELNNHAPFKGLFHDIGIGKTTTPTKTISGYLAPFFDFGHDNKGKNSDYSIHKLSGKKFPKQSELKKMGIAPDGWYGPSSVKLRALGYYKWLAHSKKNSFCKFLKQLGFSQWYDGKAPDPEWFKNDSIKAIKDPGLKYLRHHLEEVPDSNLLPALFCLYISRYGNHTTSKLTKKKWGGRSISIDDVVLKDAREAMVDALQDPDNLHYKGYDGPWKIATSAMLAWNKKLPTPQKDEKYLLNGFQKTRTKGIRKIFETGAVR